MEKSSYSALFRHPIVLSSMGAVVVIAVASGFYYRDSTRIPDVSGLSNSASSTLTLNGSGTVEPAENPNLAFASGGRVVSVRAAVGQHVSVGAVLSSLDTGALSAQRAQASANVDVAQARLAQMLAGARAEDMQTKQTAIDQANASLANLYGSAETTVVQSYDKAFSGFSQNTDSLFGQPNSNNPLLLFQTSNSQLAINVVTQRTTAQSDLMVWQGEGNALSSSSSNDQVDTALSAAIAHLRVLRTYSDSLISALQSGLPSNSFPQSAISAGQASVSTYRDSINALISSLQSSQQQIASSKISVRSAEDALKQVSAGATPEEIAAQRATVAAAQAQVQSVDAQIRTSLIIAPFSGTVASVNVKSGDIVSANTSAISLNPESALQIIVYFSEIDITKVRTGDTADVTLDAYGSARVFKAHVVSVDSAPSTVPGSKATGYKATFQFFQDDPAITSGMTANITLRTQK